MRSINALKAWILMSCLAGLAACGNEPGFDANSRAGNQAPSVSAGSDQTVDEFANVVLTGSATDADGDALVYEWEQTDGLAVTINHATSPTASFEAPDVLAASTPELLRFRLNVSDGTSTVSAVVNVTVVDAGLGTNSPPVADAGGDVNAAQSTVVELDGTGSSDPDGDLLDYSWVQVGGPDVTLTGTDTATPRFTAPDVNAGAMVALTFELTVNDGTDVASDRVVVNVAEASSLVAVTGRLSYERPTAKSRCRGYDFNDLTLHPVRRATVLLLDASGNELGRTVTDDDGNYTFDSVTANMDVRIRVRAELLQTSGRQQWRVYVRDNTTETGAKLENRPVYAVQWDLFNTGSTDSDDNDFTAKTGWGGSSYTGNRAAAPLAILDSVLNGVILVTSVDPDVDLGRLDVFWSVNNSQVDFENPDPDNGELVTAYYLSNPDFDANRNPSLFLRGDAIGRFPESQINTDEFDAYVILHEWGHFFEDQLSRSDSIGGTHWIPGTVEARVAFGEGWGNAIGAIAQGDPVGCDTGSPATSGNDLNMETYNLYTQEQGFFNEMSVATFLYDLWDTADDGVDTGSVGFQPIYETMTGFQRDTSAFTTLFSFATGLRRIVDPADIGLIDGLLEQENVDTTSLDIWAFGQATQPTQWRNGNAVRDLLPLYTDLTPGGATRNLCVNNDQVIDQHGNKPGEWRYLRLILDSPQELTLSIRANPAPPPTTDTTPGVRDRADPDVFLYQDGQLLDNGRSPAEDRELFEMGMLQAGIYTLAFQDWRYEDTEISSDYPDRVCFDFTLN
ncbi:MAG: hypothetical protein P8X98_15495 [Woeseiaceae bacterium]